MKLGDMFSKNKKTRDTSSARASTQSHSMGHHPTTASSTRKTTPPSAENQNRGTPSRPKPLKEIEELCKARSCT